MALARRVAVAVQNLNPKAEALLAAYLGSRASLGYPGEKYETGLEAIERLEVLVAEVFGCRLAEVRVPSGAIANLYAFMVTCRPGTPSSSRRRRSVAT